MENPFAPAEKQQSKARVALSGPAGSGKTYTALMLATNLSEKVAAVDTERGRMLEHKGRFKFDHFAPSRFDPRDLIKLLAAAGANGYGAIVIDSFSHYWMGSGGALEFVDAHENARGGKFSAGWKEYRPIENRMWEALMAYPGHVISTMRAKTQWVVEQNDRGKHEPKKIGMKPEQREGVDYEFSIVGEISRDHVLTITKSTCEELMDAVIDRPGPDVASIIGAWCGTGEATLNAVELRDLVLAAADFEDVRRLREKAKRARLLGAALVDDHGDDVTLDELIIRIGNERRQS
jgi:hypothetical protein